MRTTTVQALKKKIQNGATLCFFSGEKGLEKQKKIAFFNSAASLF